MRTGLKSIVLAAGLALAGLANAAPAPVASAPAPVPAAQSVTVAPVTAAPPVATVAPAAAANDPMLAEDGAPAMSPVAGIGQPVDGVYGLQPQVTPTGLEAHWFHNSILFPVITVISLFVLGLLFWVVFRYRAGANPNPSKTSHNTLIEIIWITVPVLILAMLAIPSIGLLSAQYKPAPKNAITLKAIGNQWYWSYQYPDNGGFEITANMLKDKGDANFAAGDRARTDADGPKLLAVDNRIVLPVGVPIRLITTSNDVIHSWAVPAFWIKLDAVPGRLNETSFTIEKPGLYFGQCSELCGARHGFMPIAVEAVPPATFAAWVKAKGGTMPGEVAPPAAPGGIPPAGTAPASDAAAVANATGPVENATDTPPVTNQGATANPAGAGNAGQ